MTHDDLIVAGETPDGDWAEMSVGEARDLFERTERTLANPTALWTTSEREYLEDARAFFGCLLLHADLHWLEQTPIERLLRYRTNPREDTD